MTVLAASAWQSNADLIQDVVELGYIKDTDKVVDLTFGRGKWWVKYRPKNLTGMTDRKDKYVNELEIDRLIDDIEFYTGIDYRNLNFVADETYDVCAFDPPYICMGGRDTSKMQDFADRYGLIHAPRSPKKLYEYNLEGLKEAIRITKKGGILLVKCAPYIYSGKRQHGDLWMCNDGIKLGLSIEDIFIHIGVVRAQPKRPRQLHARNNYSTLIVFRKL